LLFGQIPPAFKPAYQPVQLSTGAGGGGALTGISAANALRGAAKTNDETATMPISLCMPKPKMNQENKSSGKLQSGAE
jgi:hypothetical protein